MGQMECTLSVNWDYVNVSTTSVLLAKGHHPRCQVEREKSYMPFREEAHRILSLVPRLPATKVLCPGVVSHDIDHPQLCKLYPN